MRARLDANHPPAKSMKNLNSDHGESCSEPSFASGMHLRKVWMSGAQAALRAFSCGFCRWGITLTAKGEPMRRPSGADRAQSSLRLLNQDQTSKGARSPASLAPLRGRRLRALLYRSADCNSITRAVFATESDVQQAAAIATPAMRDPMNNVPSAVVAPTGHLHPIKSKSCPSAL